jgi:hypothetical protein
MYSMFFFSLVHYYSIHLLLLIEDRPIIIKYFQYFKIIWKCKYQCCLFVAPTVSIALFVLFFKHHKNSLQKKYQKPPYHLQEKTTLSHVRTKAMWVTHLLDIHYYVAVNLLKKINCFKTQPLSSLFSINTTYLPMIMQ